MDSKTTLVFFCPVILHPIKNKLISLFLRIHIFPFSGFGKFPFKNNNLLAIYIVLREFGCTQNSLIVYACQNCLYIFFIGINLLLNFLISIIIRNRIDIKRT